jgi:nucleotide-binding universal stress UspA family protein
MADLFQRLLLATEHTGFDAGAETVAMTMAGRCRLPLTAVLPLVSNPEYEALAPQIASRAEQDAARKIAELRTLATAAGVALELRLRRGEEAYQEIVEEAKVRNSDLIIIRRRGKRSFLANLLVGEMVSKVVAHAPCHVLIVPRQAQMWSKRILAAAEPGAQGRQIVATAAAIAAQCALPLHVLSVVDSAAQRASAEAFITEMLTQAQRDGMAAQGEVRVGKPFKEILSCANTSGADLCVIGSRSDSHIGRAMVGGVAQKVMGLSENPVLVMHL